MQGVNNLTLLTDLYQLTMMQGYFEEGMKDKIVVFDMFYRKNPCKGGYAVAAGLESVIEYIKNLSFSDEDIKYLKGLGLFSDSFLKYLKDFKFTGEIYAIPEGTVVFPSEPLVRVKAPIMEAQFIETAILTFINHQTLIATKAARIVQAAEGDAVMEFGLRRAQGPDAGTYGARAAVIAGCVGTSNVFAGKNFGLAVKGTHAHSWVMSFPSELEAFRAYARVFPEACTFLVDTYNTLEQGVPNAIKVFQEMKDAGIELKNYGVRLDSGDLAYLSKMSRIMLDEAGFEDAFICASSDLDEYLINSLKQQGAKISVWGVGTNLITSSDCPALGGVYKLSAESDGKGGFLPKIKLSNNPEKITLPGVKKVYRIYDKKTGKMKADFITLEDEIFTNDSSLTLFDYLAPWKQMHLKEGEYLLKELLVPVFIDGKCVYETPDVNHIRSSCKKEMDSLWEEVKRLVNPDTFPVDISDKLYKLRKDFISKYSNII